jgi:hypothetical protein
MNLSSNDKKISLAKFLFGISLMARAQFVRFEKESQNGLEDPKDRRSAGRHGNQHVCVRRPQVSGSAGLGLTQVDLQA